jgi:hypothetical protein
MVIFVDFIFSYLFVTSQLAGIVISLHSLPKSGAGGESFKIPKEISGIITDNHFFYRTSPAPIFTLTFALCGDIRFILIYFLL